MMEIKKIGLLSFAKMQTLLMTVFGIFMGLFQITLTLFYGTDFFPDLAGIATTGLMGFWGIIFYPIFYAFLGFIFGIFGGLFFNLFASWFGGVQVEILEKLENSEKVIKKEEIKSEEKKTVSKRQKK